jgi:hypothetical protein
VTLEEDLGVELRLVYFDGCPSWQVAHQRLAEALTRVGQPDTPISLVRVSSDAEARAAGFAGSPTILLDGRDLFPGAAIPDGLACRLYPTAAGLAGSPTVEDLVVALADQSGP